ncbi:MAG: gluconokinase [Vicinamibacterales bacterium]
MIVILMGVAGSGKTTIGTLLADELGWPFLDGDDLHPPANIDKLRRGVALSDGDREPWLERLRSVIGETAARGESAVVACSALKATYRERLRIDGSVIFVFLRGSYDLIEQRLREREGHFMSPQLLQSQFATLEEPADALVVDIDAPPRTIVDTIRHRLRAMSRTVT